MNADEFQKKLREAFSDPDWLAPLKVERADARGAADELDGELDLIWGERRTRFAYETKARSAPSVLASALQHLRQRDEPRLLIVPYISDEAARLAERAGVSVVDLCGNFHVQTPEFVALRRDRLNQYPESSPIRNIYAGASSLVGRLLLREARTWGAVGDVHKGILANGGEISLSTVSKVLAGLADELMIDKKKGSIRVLQSDRLLAKLRAAYMPVITAAEYSLRLPVQGMEEATDVLSREIDGEFVWSGVSSASRYSPIPEDPSPVLYIRDGTFPSIPPDWHEPRFYNCRALVCGDSLPFFDTREGWASPVQACLELSKLDKRERELAETIATTIIAPFCEA